MQPLTRALALTAAVPLLLLGCSGGGSSTSAPSPSATPTTTEAQYADAAPTLASWSEPTLDVVTIPGGSARPLVVVLPPHGLVKSDPATVQIARSLAEHGAVAVAANWSQLDDPPAVFTDAASTRAFAQADQSLAGCAVSYAVAHAADYGADPSHLVLVGDLFGANTAAMVALATPPAYPGCRSTATWSAAGLVGIDGDWLVAYDVFDPVATAAFAALSPWSSTTVDPGPSVTLLSTEAAASATARCEPVTAAWIVARDPSGKVRARLTSTGAYADGCVDLRDAATAFASDLTAAGLDAHHSVLENTDGTTTFDAGAHFQTVGASDLEAIVAAALATSG